jgi:hypothetical protein
MKHVSDDKWRDGVKYLMGLGCNPTLTRADQLKLSAQMRGPFKNGFSMQGARRVLRALGWKSSTSDPKLD